MNLTEFKFGSAPPQTEGHWLSGLQVALPHPPSSSATSTFRILQNDPVGYFNLPVRWPKVENHVFPTRTMNANVPNLSLGPKLQAITCWNLRVVSINQFKCVPRQRQSSQSVTGPTQAVLCWNFRVVSITNPNACAQRVKPNVISSRSSRMCSLFVPTNVAAFGWAKYMLSLSSSVCRASRIVLCENIGFRTCDVQAATCTSLACGTRSGSVASSSCFKRVELCPVSNTCTKRKGHVLNKAYRVGGERVICEICKAF